MVMVGSVMLVFCGILCLQSIHFLSRFGVARRLSHLMESKKANHKMSHNFPVSDGSTNADTTHSTVEMTESMLAPPSDTISNELREPLLEADMKIV